MKKLAIIFLSVAFTGGVAMACPHGEDKPSDNAPKTAEKDKAKEAPKTDKAKEADKAKTAKPTEKKEPEKKPEKVSSK